MANNKKTYIFELKGVNEAKQSIVTLNDVLNELNNTLTNKERPELITQDVIDTLRESVKAIQENNTVQSESNEQIQRNIVLTTDLTDEQKKTIETQFALNNAKKEYRNQLKDELAAQNDWRETTQKSNVTLSELRNALSLAKKELAGIDMSSDSFKAVTKEVADLNEKVLQAEKDFGQFNRQVGNYELVGKSMKGELKEMQAQMAAMLSQGVNPSDEAFQELARRAGELVDSISDARAEIKRFADDSRQIKNVTDIAKTATSAFGLYTGTMQMFGIENEKVEESLSQLMAVQTTLNSLQELSQGLTDNSTMSYKLYHKALELLGLEKKKNISLTGAETAATVANTTATVSSTAATTTATGATKLLSAAMKTIPILLLISGIGLLIGYWEDIVGWFKKTIMPLNDVGGAFDKIIAVVKTVGQTITDYFLLPFKTAIAGVKGMIDGFKADGIIGAVKGAFNGAKDEAIKGGKELLNVSDKYNSNYQDQTAKHLKEVQKIEEKANTERLKTEIEFQTKVNGNAYKNSEKYKEDRQNMFDSILKSLGLYGKDYVKELENIYLQQKKLGDKADKDLMNQVESALSIISEQNSEKEKKEEEAKKAAEKRAEEAKKLNEKRKDDIKKLNEQIVKIEQDTNKLIDSNDRERLKVQMDSLSKLNTYTNEQLNLKLGKIKEINNLEQQLIQKQLDSELKKIKEEYDKIIKEAERLGQSTLSLKEDYAKRIDEVTEEYNIKLEQKQKEYSDYALEEQSKLNELLLKNQKEYLKSTEEGIKNQIDTLKNLKIEPPKMDIGMNMDVIDKDLWSKQIEEGLKVSRDLVNSLKPDSSERQEVIAEWDAMISDIGRIYGQDSDNYKQAVKDKENSIKAMDAQYVVALESEKKWADKSKSQFQDYWKSVSEVTQKYGEVANKGVEAIFGSISDIMQLSIDSLNEQLDGVTERYDETVAKVEESYAAIDNIKSEMQNADGARFEELKQQMADEQGILVERQKAEKQAAKEKEKLEEDIAKKEKQQKKVQFAQQMITGLINTAVGITQALSSSPPPLSFVMAALVGAMGAIQTGIIASQMSKLEEGGVLEGKSHSQGGIKGTGRFNNIEVEGGEFVVNKKSTKKYLPLIQAINADSIPVVNNMKNKLANGGILNTDMINSAIQTQSIQAQIDSSLSNINFNPVVAVTDILTVQQQMTRVNDYAGSNTI